MPQSSAAIWVLMVAVAIPLYAYLGYPALLWAFRLVHRRPQEHSGLMEWPSVTITIPVYNEKAGIRTVLERILQFDYPRDRMQILVISDASTDGTDDIANEFATRGVELLRLPQRGGKTAAENAALPHLRGEIVVNTDATIRIPPDSLRKMLRWFADPLVGVVSGRDVSMAHMEDDANVGESGYVGYEMWVRRLETQVDGIIGASGCFYGIRKHLHRQLVPEALSRDFAAPLVARENGFRSVSAHEAVCFVPRAPSLETEYRRKVRTMTRGLETLFYKRQLLNPFRYGWFAWMLWSHKLLRWLVPWALVAGAVALAVVPGSWMHWVAALGALGVLFGLVGWRWRPAVQAIPLLRTPAYMVAGLTASLHAWINALRGELNPIWEPTRRDG